MLDATVVLDDRVLDAAKPIIAEWQADGRIDRIEPAHEGTVVHFVGGDADLAALGFLDALVARA